jgi:hypothetical protein
VDGGGRSGGLLGDRARVKWRRRHGGARWLLCQSRERMNWGGGVWSDTEWRRSRKGGPVERGVWGSRGCLVRRGGAW